MRKPCGGQTVACVVGAEHRAIEGSRGMTEQAHAQHPQGQAQDYRLRWIAYIPISQMRREAQRGQAVCLKLSSRAGIPTQTVWLQSEM